MTWPPDADELERLYYDKALSMEQIAEAHGVTAESVMYHMDKHGIERRGFSEAQSTRYEREPHNHPEVLRRLYHGWGLTQAEVGEFLGVEESTVQGAMRRLSVARRKGGPRPREPPEAEKIRELYWGEELTIKETANELGISANVLIRWMNELGIERRKPGAPAGSNGVVPAPGVEENEDPETQRRENMRKDPKPSVAGFLMDEWGEPGEPEWKPNLSAAEALWDWKPSKPLRGSRPCDTLARMDSDTDLRKLARRAE